MRTSTFDSLNHFYSGHIIVNKDRKIIFCNDYICDLSDQTEEQLINRSISQYMSKASNIFIDSYIYPLLINELVVQEIQVTWVDKNGKKIPVVVNIKLEQDGLSYWSLYVCTNRDKLHSELLKANQKLESQSLELFSLASTDPLTGLLNRRELQVQTQKIISQVSRNSSTFALLSIDVDFFKQVNDTYGHQAGDNVLKNLANIFNASLRGHDLIARIGGEEFVLLLQDVDENNAFKLAEKLRKNIEENPIGNINITVSIGLVVTRDNVNLDLDMLLKLSDEALYDAKKSGRNRTSVAQF